MEDGGVFLRNLLDSSSLRRVDFIEFMLEDDQWRKIEDVALKLSCSESTVKADMDYFSLAFSNDFCFETSKQYGIRIKMSPSFQMDNFYQRIMSECLNVQLVQLIFWESVHTLEEYADALYTSVSSIKRSLEQVKKVLVKYDLSIHQKPIRIVGKEKQVLFFYGVFFWEKYGTSFLDLNYAYANEANTLVMAFKKQMNLPLSFTVISKIALWIGLIFERISKGHHMEEDYSPIFPISGYMEEFLLEQTMKLPFQITEKDGQFIGYYLESRYLYFPEKTLQTKPILYNVYTNINCFLESLSEETGAALKNKRAVQNKLFSQFVYQLEFKGFNYLLVDRNKIALLNNEEIYTCFVVAAVNLLKERKNSMWADLVLADPIDFFYILISTWENLTTEIFIKRKRINTLIVSQFGLHHEKFLAELIELRFPYSIKTFLLTERKYESEKIELILSDHEVEKIRLHVEQHIPVIGIHYSPNNQTWKHLKEMIDQLFLDKQKVEEEKKE